jgi:hypothetical protein
METVFGGKKSKWPPNPRWSPLFIKIGIFFTYLGNNSEHASLINIKSYMDKHDNNNITGIKSQMAAKSKMTATFSKIGILKLINYSCDIIL